MQLQAVNTHHLRAKANIISSYTTDC